MTRRLPIHEVHEIELSSVCNLACNYCPHPSLRRPKQHMSSDIFQRALEHVRHYCRRGSQTELSLTGIGEAILHPALEQQLMAVREVMGPRRVVLSTNGVALTDHIAQMLAKYGVYVFVSLHRPEVAGPATEKLRRAGCQFEVSHAFVDRGMDWAGQVDWPVSSSVYPCNYLRRGWAVIRQCGSVDACCMDAHDLHPIGHVRDDVGSLMTNAMDLCASCHLTVPDEFRN